MASLLLEFEIIKSWLSKLVRLSMPGIAIFSEGFIKWRNERGCLLAINDFLSHISGGICSSHFPDFLCEKSLSSALCKSRQCLWHSFWNKNAYTSSFLYLSNQWHSNICSTALRIRSCSSLSEMLHLKGVLSLPTWMLCRELMKHFSSLAILHLQIGTVLSPPGKKYPFEERSFDKKFLSGFDLQKKAQRKYLGRNKIIIFFLNNNNVYHW